MTGTILNVATVLLGSFLGLFLGARLSERLREMLTAVLGLFTLAIGVDMFLDGLSVEGENILIPLVSLLVGGILGEWWRVEERLQALGARLEARFAGGTGEVQGGNRFIRGFVTASLLFCVGPMTILGSIQDGLMGDYQLLAVKSVMDGFASLALASAFGVGVFFSALVVLLYQGGLSLGAAQLQHWFTPLMMAELSAVGGVLLLSLAVGPLLNLKPVRTANLLPALLVAPLLSAVLTASGF